MTGFAKHRIALEQEICMIRAVRLVARNAVLFDWCMLKHVRTALVSVALVAKVVGVIGLDHAVRERAVWVVTITATHFTFNDWVM
jgi:hypothetical protein